MNNLEELSKKINIHKEILDAMPKNNSKNIKEYINLVENLKIEFSSYQQDVLREMEKRLKQIKNVKKNLEIEELKQKIDNNEGVLYLLNTVDTSYEKMDLDKSMFNLKQYYNKNLEIVNESISYCIKKFEEVGIELGVKDFDYSEYVKEYFTIFFSDLESEKINSKKIKNKFDEIYWKCPEIILHIELNIRYLYLKNEKKIDKYYNNQKRNLLRNFTAKEIETRFEELKKQYDIKVKEDKAILTHKFLDGELSTKDYTQNSILDNYTMFIPREEIENIDNNRMNEINLNICKLINSIYEYKKYLQFKFIIDDIKKKYNEQENYKNTYVQTKKEIMKKEKKRILLNKKINKKSNTKKRNNKNVEQRNNLIIELKQLYKDLDTYKIYNKVATKLSDESTIDDVLYVASSFYGYLFTCAYENNKEITEEEIDKIIEELKEFVKYPYKTIINNIKILDERNIELMIKDRYQLLNMNIKKEDLQQDNLDSLIDIATRIEIMSYIKKNKVDLEQIENACEFKKILNK